MHTKLLQTFVLGVTFGMAGCSATSSPSDQDSGGGNAPGSGGSTSAGNTSTSVGGGTNSGTGGTTAIAGSANGGAGTSTGGSTTFGGSANGGTGTSTGGSTAFGGSANGGTGTSTGGSTASGGSSNGGTTAAGGMMGMAGAAHGGTGGSGQAGAAGSGTGGGTSVSCNGPALSGGTQHCSSNASGTVAGNTWTIWSSGSGGCMTTYGTGAAYKATWNNSGDFLAREGAQWDETKTFDQLGTIAADFAYTKTGSGGGYSFIGIYGWSNNPLIEFYIVDDWYGSGPPTGGGAMKGSFTIDGAKYNVYQHQQTNQPSIHGTQTFQQYFSVRQTARQCGHISISEHFKEWASLGMGLGKMYEAKILVEVGGGSGSIDFTSASLTAK